MRSEPIQKRSPRGQLLRDRRLLGWTGLGLSALGLSVLAAPATAGPTIRVGDESFLTIDYGVQPWFQNRSYTSSTDSGATEDFFLRRNRLTFAGQYNDMVGFYVQIEAGNDSKVNTATGQAESDKPVYYRDAYVTIDYSDPVRFIVGRFKNTVTRENLEACFEPLTMDRGEILPYTPFAGSRDTGVAMWGNLVNAHLQYRLMVADGREGDNVPQKEPRYSARVHWSFFDPEFEYGYRGTYLGTKTVLTVGASADYQTDVVYYDYALRTNPKDYKGTTADVFYEQPFSIGTFTASAAWMKWDTGNAINSPSVDPTLPVTSQLEGYYAKAGYLLPGKIGIGRLQFTVRYENQDYNLDSGYRNNNWKSVGANYYIDGQKLKLSAEYAKVEYDRQHPTDPSLQDYNQFTLGLQFIF